jgi:hypothetical protein
MLSGCDTHFPVSGTLKSGNDTPLTGCWIIYQSRGSQRTSALTVPEFTEGFTTDRVPRTVVFSCDRHKPQVVELPHNGHVGIVVLPPSGL